MKITICNSIHFFEDAKKAKVELDESGHEAITHPMEIEFEGKMVPVIEYYKLRKSTWNDSIEQRKEDFMRDHFEKIKNSDAVLVLNIDKDGKKNYVGGNAFLEMGLAFALGKKIFMLNPIPEELSYAEEIKGMRPIIIEGDLSRIK
jgi:nucleoside 2-deoxyribosyltransferase